MQAKKAEAEVERHKKAAALRKYAKLCKAEGIESARVNVDKTAAPAASDKGSASPSAGAQGKSRQEKRDARDAERRERKGIKGKGSGKPFEKEMRQHEDSQTSKKEEDARRAANDKAVKEKQKARDEARKLHMKRTSKGQPLMNNRINSLLSKIEKTMGQ